MSAMVYGGAFPLDMLGDDETVRSAGDGTGAAIVSLSTGYELRVEIGDHIDGPPFRSYMPWEVDRG